jgi:hypothetical protein
MVQSDEVKAFMKVLKLLLSIEKNGSCTGNLLEPHKAVCSNMWATPVESEGTVLKATLKVFSLSLLLM